MIELLFITGVFAWVIWYVGSPLFSRGSHPSERQMGEWHERDLLVKKSEILSSLSDLELDHQMKKVSDENFKTMYDETVGEGALILKEIDDSEKKKKDALK